MLNTEHAYNETKNKALLCTQTPRYRYVSDTKHVFQPIERVN